MQLMSNIKYIFPNFFESLEKIISTINDVYCNDNNNVTNSEQIKNNSSIYKNNNQSENRKSFRGQIFSGSPKGKNTENLENSNVTNNDLKNYLYATDSYFNVVENFSYFDQIS